MEKKVFSKININFTDKTHIHLNPNFEQVYNLVKRASDDLPIFSTDKKNVYLS